MREWDGLLRYLSHNMYGPTYVDLTCYERLVLWVMKSSHEIVSDRKESFGGELIWSVIPKHIAVLNYGIRNGGDPILWSMGICI